MDVYIVADMEGISGIVNGSQVTHGAPDFHEGQRLLVGDINAAIAGAVEAGATRVVVNDFHDSRRNILIEQMDPRAEYEVGHGTMMPALRRGFAAVLVVGMHAKAGTQGGFLEHSVDPAWHHYWINGRAHGEFALIAFTAGVHGAPTVFIAGDRAAIDEARALVPTIESCVVKEGLASEWCRAAAPAVAHEWIHAGVVRALTRRDEIVCPVLDFPATVRIEFNRCAGADVYDGRSDITRIDGVTIEWTARSSDELVPF